MDIAVIVRGDGGVSLFPWKTEEEVQATFKAWCESARKEWLPARLERTSVPIPDQNFHGSRMVADDNGHMPDNCFLWDEAERCVKIDMGLARENYAKRLIRKERAKLFKPLDDEYRLADEAGDTQLKNEIIGKKRVLRDATKDQRIESAKTPEELKLVWRLCLTV